MVLDIGCGDGKVTAEISRFVEAGRVLGIDSSKEMLTLAASTYGPTSRPNLSFQFMDARELVFHEEFDLVFSNAALHWVIDHRPVLAGIYASLKKGGRMVVQMGGEGNAGEVLSALDNLIAQEMWQQFFHDFPFPYGFYGPDEYGPWLRQAGFVVEKIELIPKEMVHESVDQFKGWIRTTWLPYLNRIPGNKRELFVDQLTQEYRSATGQLANDAVHTKMIRLEFAAQKEV